MKIKYIILIIMMQSSQLWAFNQEVIVLDKPVFKIKDRENVFMYSICQQMKHDFIDEVTAVNKLYQQLKLLTQQSELDQKAITDLADQISVHSERIRSLARPEWNSEVIDLHITWLLHRSLMFFNEEKYNNVLMQIRSEGMRSVSRRDLQIAMAGKPNTITKIDLTNVSYLGHESSDLRKDIYAGQFLNFDYAIDNDEDFTEFSINKSATYLELCQFIQTIDIDAVVYYESNWLNLYKNYQQKSITPTLLISSKELDDIMQDSSIDLKDIKIPAGIVSNQNGIGRKIKLLVKDGL